MANIIGAASVIFIAISPVRMKIDRHGTATIRKRYDSDTAIITVGVRLEDGEFSIRSQFEQPVVLQPTSECSRSIKGEVHCFSPVAKDRRSPAPFMRRETFEIGAVVSCLPSSTE